MSNLRPDSKECFDAIVVGSGATGGLAAKELDEAASKFGKPALLQVEPRGTGQV